MELRGVKERGGRFPGFVAQSFFRERHDDKRTRVGKDRAGRSARFDVVGEISHARATTLTDPLGEDAERASVGRGRDADVVESQRVDFVDEFKIEGRKRRPTKKRSVSFAAVLFDGVRNALLFLIERYNERSAI